VVGVILNLALFFAWHVLWPEASLEETLSGRFEWFSLRISLAAFADLRGFKFGIVPVIGSCALAGLAYSWFT